VIQATREAAGRGALPTLDAVQAFWNVEACGTHFIPDAKSRREFFERYSRFRYETEWHIPRLVPFAAARGRKVLEIGCGNGADGVLFAQNGAVYTGIDLTPAAVAASKEHFDLMGVRGDFQIGNAEALLFPDASFSMVYSYGVLHHSPDPQKAVNEIWRVLEPGGVATIMLYNRHSFNYFVRIMLIIRLRALAYCLIHHRPTGKRNAAEGGNMRVRGSAARAVWAAHYANFLREGYGYFRARNFVHHATDGPACPRAFVFTRRDVRKMFARFDSVRVVKVHFPLRKYLGQWVPTTVESVVSSRIGWYLLVFATK